MKALKHKSIEFSEVLLSELGQEMRFDSEYWEPTYLRNEDLLKSKKHTQTKQLAPNIQYGISIAMNETGIGYPILKMDNIMDMLADDKDSKFADISAKTFHHFELKKFDVLFNRVNSDEFVGRTGIYLLDGEHTFASYLVKVDTQKPHTNCYLTTFLNCKYGKISLQRVKRRAVNQANINAKELSNLHIPLPTEPFQKAIQELLVEAQKQKVLSEKLYKEAEEILLDELGLLNWKPKTIKFNHYKVPFENEVNYSTQYTLKDTVFSNRIDGEYYEPKYAEILDILNAYSVGCTKVGNHFNQRIEMIKKIKPEFNYIEIGDVDISSGKANFNLIEKSELPANAKLSVKIGDILYSKVRPYRGAVSIIEEEIPDVVVSGAFTVLSEKNNSKYNKETLFVLLKSSIYKTLIMKYNVGSSYPVVKDTNVMNLPLPLFDKKIQNTIKIKINNAIHSRQQSTFLLKTSKTAVETFIEEDEKKAIKYLNSNTKANKK